MVKEITWEEHMQRKLKRAKQRYQKLSNKPHRIKRFLPWWKYGVWNSERTKIYYYSKRKTTAKQITHRKERTLERQIISLCKSSEREVYIPDSKKLIDFWWLVL
ncbi:hypothetical protein [Anaerocellum danielii]|uniref:Uncharacterized protein n=1 Tax=Anaerocellum danielii TaxID=1387557 RepID=A0ABZ0TYA6_9FIRM|nr:hypothetical protein [Caldicellulosiruptor danielii]WPX08197.1 hypothetical protein SOJ16_002063 [Caldicellulosiruptor danielii]